MHNQTIENHTLPEIAQHKQHNPSDNYLLLNNEALHIGHSPIKIQIAQSTILDIEYARNTKELQHWFAKNRIPERKFHAIPKHGQNGRGNWNGASALMCSQAEGQKLLNTAIGDSIHQLFNFDSKHNTFIVFRHENEPENFYHGYHLPANTTEIPNRIKNLLK